MNNNYPQKITEQVAALFQYCQAHYTPQEMEKIREALEFATEAHKGQTRKTGEPYIIHPIAVADIVAREMELGAVLVMAAFLHDVVEDTPYTQNDIADRFGPEVARLVGVVTKSPLQKQASNKQVDNYKQILTSVKFNVHAVLIKLADRLHNMRTLSSMPPNKQLKIAGETDYLYAPLANRLGLYFIKTELENLSFRYRCPREYAELQHQLEDDFKANEDPLNSFVASLQRVLNNHIIYARIEVCQRMPYSVWRKMQASGCDFNHVDGKHYIRIVYPAKSAAEEKKLSLEIYSLLTDYFKERPGSVSNYINSPKENGYQSFHVKLFRGQSAWEEIHISSERMVRNSRLGCAAERSDTGVKEWLAKFSALLQDLACQDKCAQRLEYMESVEMLFYNDDIMVFTPEGRGIILPKGATVIDFAFEIHTELGMHAEYARINDKLVSIKTILHRGDCVQVFTSPEVWPESNWAEHALTYKALSNIKAYMATRPSVPYVRCSCCHPLPGDEVVGFSDPAGNVVLHKRHCLKAIRLASQRGDSIVALNFEANPEFMYPVRIRFRGIDRYHLLGDVLACFTTRLKLSIAKLETETRDRIAECTIDFFVHSAAELQTAKDYISAIRGVDEVVSVDIE